jgi:hemin uptake protein HemP
MASPTQNAMEIHEMQPKSASASSGGKVMRIKSQDLFKQMREIEIDHDGRIYRLRLTQLNKLILTA